MNEKIRTLLRLEFLFGQVRHFLHGESEWDSRAGVTTLLELYALFTRADLKGELLKELERHAASLVRLEQMPGVDGGRLRSILGELGEISDALRGSAGLLGAHLKDNEFLASIRQRSSIPGGTCDFDLPLYHYWLQLPSEQRIVDLDAWADGFEPAARAVRMMLKLIRESASPSREVAHAGGFQKNLAANIPCQMVRVAIPDGLPLYPEVSGGKHRFTIRFLEHRGFDARPVQSGDDVEFQLAICVI